MKPTKISELLKKINRIDTDTDFNAMSKLEIDIALQHLRELYEELSVLKYGDVSVAVKDPVITKRTLNPNQNILMNEAEVEKVKSVVGDNTNNGNSIKIEQVKQIKKEEPAVKAEVKEQVSKSSINESVQSVASLNEKHKSGSKEVHKQLSTKPLKDLIDLNKKFILQNELFAGNTIAFTAAVHQIDSSTDYAAAEKFLLQLQIENRWDQAAQSTRLLSKLVKQKFGEE